MNNHKIILISGAQGSGKTTLADTLAKRLRSSKGFYPYQELFAGPIYEMHDFCRNILRENGVTPPHEIKDGNLLQLLGTEWGRNTIGENIWAEVLKGKIERTQKRLNVKEGTLIFIVSDCRFRNEFDAFPEALRVRLSCNRDVRKKRVSMWRENERHLSEIDLDGYALNGQFDLNFDSEFETPEHMAELIHASLVKNVWMEKRK